MISFQIVGDPAPQGSKTAIVTGGKIKLIEGRNSTGRLRHKTWRDTVANAARDNAPADGPLDGPLGLEITFRMRRPASRPKNHHGWHATTPDLDKLLRAVGDALVTGGLIRDDSRIAVTVAYAIEVTDWTGAEINVRQLAPRNHPDRWAPAPTGIKPEVDQP